MNCVSSFADLYGTYATAAEEMSKWRRAPYGENKTTDCYGAVHEGCVLVFYAFTPAMASDSYLPFLIHQQSSLDTITKENANNRQNMVQQ